MFSFFNFEKNGKFLEIICYKFFKIIWLHASKLPFFIAKMAKNILQSWQSGKINNVACWYTVAGVDHVGFLIIFWGGGGDGRSIK